MAREETFVHPYIPNSVPEVKTKMLETKGEGLCAIAYPVSNYDEVVSRLQEQGSKMVISAIAEGKRWCYFDTRPGGILLELQEI